MATRSVVVLEFDGIEIREDFRPLVGSNGETYPYFFVVGHEGYERFGTIERCVVEAIAAKYCGQRGAGGTGVDTAAGWFAKMIGMEGR